MMLRIYRQLIVLCICAFCCSFIQAEAGEKQMKITLRTIGHQFLLELGDSASLVLPVEKVGERYSLGFEKDFAFMPDVLTSVVYQLMEEKELNRRFIVEIVECETEKVVHSFEADLLQEEGKIACKGRMLPQACYVFYFTIIPQQEATTQLQAKTEDEKNYIYLLLPLLLVGGIAFYLIKRNVNQDAEQITIGQFQFDQKRMTLNLKAQSIELSTKESDLLLLLYNHENDTLERAYILNQIWGDEGDYVGRTLDVFISKLRKKIAADPNLKIINVRGVGYRFVVS